MNNLSLDVLSLYLHLHSLNVRPDSFTFPFVLKACTELLDVWFGMAVHGLIAKFELDEDAIVSTELTVMYAKFGDAE